MERKWCLSRSEWVQSVERWVAVAREGGTGGEQTASQKVEICPSNDGTTTRHLLIDAPPA